MAYPLLSPSIRSMNYNSSNLSPLTSRLVDSVVPTGTVASRIVLLQTLATPSAPDMPRPLISRGRENSRTGFGRRASGRFGKPASRISVSLEQPEIVREHSFLGHRTSRANHMEAHAHANQTSKWNRRIGLLSQLEPQVLETRVQCDATSPWGVVLKPKSSKDIQLDREQGDLTSTKPVSYLKVPSNAPLVYSGDGEPSPRYQDTMIQKCGTASHHFPKKQQEDQMSIETTSSMRRHSVKELYKQYGIQRPVGLVSYENLTYDADASYQSQRKHKRCHACLWLNGTETRCWRCGHRFCESCDDLSLRPVTEKKGSSQYRDNMPKGDIFPPDSATDELALLKVSVPDEGSNRRNAELIHMPQKLLDKREYSENRNTETARNLSQREISQSINLGRVTPCQVSSKTPLAQIEIFSTPASPLPLPQVPKAKAGYKFNEVIANSPFLVADRLSQPHLWRILPVSMRIMDRPAHSHGSHRMTCRSRSPSQDNSSPEDQGLIKEFTCDSPGCRATHSGHRPYRHSISCSRSKRYNPDYNHRGHRAHTSDQEEHSITAQSKNNKDRPIQPDLRLQDMPEWTHLSDYRNSTGSKDLADRDRHQHSQPKAEIVRSTQDVEIHGCTGNEQSRNSSPIASVVIGKYQHSMIGKQNETRQSSHHGVHCYTCNNHSEALYNSETCRQINESTEKPEIIPLSPLINRKQIAGQCRPELSEDLIAVVIMPTPRRKINSPSWMTAETFETAADARPEQRAHGNLTEIAPVPKLKSKVPREVTAQGTSVKQYSMKEMPDTVRHDELPPRPVGEDIIRGQEKSLMNTPSRTGQSTLAELKAKRVLERTADQQERSMKATLNTNFGQWRQPKKVTKAPPTVTEVEPSRLKGMCVEYSPEEDQNIGNKSFKTPPSRYDSCKHHFKSATSLPNPSSPIVIPLQPSGSVRRLSALFSREGTGVISSLSTMSQRQQDELRRIQTMRKKSLKGRFRMAEEEIVCEDKNLLDRKLEKQHEEIQQVDDMRQKSLKECVDCNEEEKRRRHAVDTTASKRENTRLSIFPTHDTDNLESNHEYEVLLPSANQPKHPIREGDTANAGNESPDKRDVATGTRDHANPAEAKFSIVKSSSILDYPNHVPGWKDEICAEDQPGSDISTDEADNESFEFADLGIKGISVIFHLEGREDLVIKADLGG